jgi:hypothetical protein
VDEELPDWRFTWDPYLATDAFRQMEITGILPLPEEVARVPRSWREEVFAAGHNLQFQRDGLSSDN